MYCIVLIMAGAHRCMDCGKSFSRKDRLHHHLINVHGKGNPERKCSYRFCCPFKCQLPPFRTMKLLLEHCMSVHKESLGETE